MTFDIQPSHLVQPGYISLPFPLRKELGVILGQFLQIKNETTELVLQIGIPVAPNQECALVNTGDYDKVSSSNVSLKILEVTLGCDPEFFILWDRRRVVAATYLPFVGQIGCDGELGELRPSYGRHESQVVNNLASLIPQIPSKLRRTTWAKGFPEDGSKFAYEAHSYYSGVAAGFHVHLGIPPEILNTRREFNRAALNHLVQCLDWYVSVPMIPLEVSHQRRVGKSNYGRPGDYRTSNVTLEYRTPGAFYLRSPKLAGGLMGLALLVTENLVSKLKVISRNFVKLPDLSKADLQEVFPKPDQDTIRDVLLSQSVSPALRALDGIRSTLEKLPSFDKHRSIVDSFFSAVEEKEEADPNLLTNWKEKP